MNNLEVENKVAHLLARVLKIDVTRDSALVRGECEQWDSLNHIDVIMSIEEEFDISLTESQMETIKSQKEIVALVLAA
jgi:acyl carrier protein